MSLVTKKEDVLKTIKDVKLTYQQRVVALALASERLFDPQELLGFTDADVKYLENDFICDLGEGFAFFRPRYIVPNYGVFITNGSKYFELDPPSNMDDVLDGLLILYMSVPSVGTLPAFIGNIDKLIEPFVTDEEVDYPKIKRFLNHVDKTIPTGFCHANIGPEDTRAGRMILQASMELMNPTPNLSLKYDKDKTSDEFLTLAAKCSLIAAKPSIANDRKYFNDMGDYAIVSCYNALRLGGGGYTLPRLRYGTIAASCNSLDEMLNDVMPKVIESQLSMMDKKIRFTVEEVPFFKTHWLVKEGFIKQENFTGMAGMVGLADAVNHFLKLEGLDETFGSSTRGDEIGMKLMQLHYDMVDAHEGVYCESTNNKYFLHAQVGAFINDEDYRNTPGHRIKIGQEPDLADHMNHSAKFQEFFKAGTGDIFSFDQTYENKPEAIVDVIKGLIELDYRFFTTYMDNQDLVRVTGYLAKRSEMEKYKNGGAVMRDTAFCGSGTDDIANILDRKVRIDAK